MRGDVTIPFGGEDGLVVPLARPGRQRAAGRFGDYDVVRPLARGGMGGVYLAAHVVTGEKVALKVLDPHFANYPEIINRLDAEHALSARANHRGVVEIRAARRTEDDVPYLVMEYLEGETLGTLAARGKTELSIIVAICAQVAAALSALHAAGVIHCDVKHENVFVLADQGTGWPRIKVIDFGVSRQVGEPAVAEALIAGTPWCMAPEQWSGRPTPKSDVYALGCLLYDLTTGAPPFDGSLPELMVKHVEQRPARPSWLRAMPIALERLILRALAKDPDERPAMHELASGLFELLGASAPIELRQAG